MKLMSCWVQQLQGADGRLADVAGIDQLSPVMQTKLRSWLLGDLMAFSRAVTRDTYLDGRNKVRKATGIDIENGLSPELQAAAVTTIRDLFVRGFGFRTYEKKWAQLVAAVQNHEPPKIVTTSQPQHRKALIKTLLVELEKGVNVPINRFMQALTKDEYQGYRSLMHRNAHVMLIPGESQLLKQYGQHLSIADKLFALAESKPRKASIGLKNTLKKTPHRKAESAYDKAYEFLEQLSPSTYKFFDRPVNFLADDFHGFGPDPESAPRLIGSRSAYALKDFYAVNAESKALKLEFLKNSLSQIDNPASLTKLDGGFRAEVDDAIGFPDMIPVNY
jgi:hypothetical protein